MLTASGYASWCPSFTSTRSDTCWSSCAPLVGVKWTSCCTGKWNPPSRHGFLCTCWPWMCECMCVVRWGVCSPHFTAPRCQLMWLLCPHAQVALLPLHSQIIFLIRYKLPSRQSGECRCTRGSFSFQVWAPSTLWKHITWLTQAAHMKSSGSNFLMLS